MILYVLLLGLLIRLIGLNQSLWLDEAINVLAVKNNSLIDLITRYSIGDFHPPGFSILLWFWTHAFGISEIAIRVPSVIFAVLTIYVVYLIGNKLHSKALGLLAALFLAINPLHVYYSQEARMYSLAALAVSLNMLLFINYSKNRTVFYVLSNFLILMSDYVAYLVFPAQFIFLVLSRDITRLKNWLVNLAVSLFLMIWWLPVFINQLSEGMVTSANLPTWKFVVGGFDIKAVPLTLVKFIIGRISLADKDVYYMILVPVCLFFLFILLKGIKFIDGKYRNLLISWLILPVIFASGISFIVPIYSYFRLLYVIPVFVILIAFGIISYKSKFRLILIGTVLSIQIFSLSVYLFNNMYQREGWKLLVSYLKSQDYNSLVLFESSGTLPPFDYYAQKTINARGALKDFPAKDETYLIDLPLAERPRDIFLVDYLVEITDPKRLVAKKLLTFGYELLETKDFSGIGFIYHYVKK